MKTIILLSACILLAIVVENTGSPVSGNTGTKPGSCYRPVGRRRRSAEDESLEDESLEDTETFNHVIEKRHAHAPSGGSSGGNQWRPPGNGNGGSQGGNPWKPPPTPSTTPRPECYTDHQCLNNKKCCSGQCQTPSFTG